ncbi:glycosyl hydrolase, partial [bacterium]
MTFKRRSSLALLPAVACLTGSAHTAPEDALHREFTTPPNAAKPWVYWYFNDGWVNKVGMKGDLEAMKKAGIGGALFLEIDWGITRGPAKMMSSEWLKNFAYGVGEAKRLGLQIGLGSAPGWTGTGGPWIKPEQAMQILVASETTVTGPTT